MTYIVTGAAGFIGANIIQGLKCPRHQKYHRSR